MPKESDKQVSQRIELHSCKVGALITDIADNPGQVSNPLFVYGRKGCGKTELMEIVERLIHKKHPEKIVMCVKEEIFIEELILNIRDGKLDKFHRKYRNADVFILDDVHRISGKNVTQEEVLNIFDSLYNVHKQLVFSSAIEPRKLDIRKDLRNRLQSGIIVNLNDTYR